MATINNYSETDFRNPPSGKAALPFTISTYGCCLAVFGPNMFYYTQGFTSPNRMVGYKLDGLTSDNNFTLLTGAFSNSITGSFNGIGSIGASSDGSVLYLFTRTNPASTSTLYAINTTTGVNSTTTITPLPVTTPLITMGGFSGKILNYTVGGNFLFVSDSNGNVWLIDLNTSIAVKIYTNGISALSSCHDTTLWNDGTDDYLIFSCIGDGSFQVAYFKINITLPITEMTKLSSVSTISTPGSIVSGGGLFCVSVDQSSNTLFLARGRNVYQTTISNSGGGVLTYTYDGTSMKTPTSLDVSSDISTMVCNSAAGEAHGNLRVFVGYKTSASSTDVVKLWNPSIPGIIGTSLGGDPHLLAANGKSVTITPETKFLFLDTLSESKNFNIKIECDSFTLSKNLHLISEYQKEKVALNESYLKTFILTMTNEKQRKIVVNCVNLDVDYDEEEQSKFIKIGEKIDCSILNEEEFPEIRSKQYKKDLLLYRKIVILTDEITFDFEFIRTKCINYSDINLEMKNYIINPWNFRGAAIDGEIIFLN